MSSKEKQLHIVSFDVPFPPVYGGIIDVYYKIRSLSLSGVKITLHAYSKQLEIDDAQRKGLEKYCHAIHIYQRQMDWTKAIRTTPFIIASREESQLIANLQKDDSPILLEGMHAASVLDHPSMSKRRIFLRMHNIEWDYYKKLSGQEERWWKKLYLWTESVKLKASASKLERADQLLTISQYEQETLSKRYPNCKYLPPFHAHNANSALMGRGSYALYHGNLAIAENRRAVEYLVSRVFPGLDIPFKVAGAGAPEAWTKKMSGKVELTHNASDEELEELIRNAHINIFVTFQNTGVKLKLINALFCGRHCIVNRQMVEGSNLAQLCKVADNAEQLQSLLRETMAIDFSEQDQGKRNAVLAEEFNNRVNGKRLIEWIYPHP